MNSNKYRALLVLVLLISIIDSVHASARIRIKGSDTLAVVAELWVQAYKEINPNTVISVSGSNSGAGIASFINGAVEIANSSRAMRPGEIMLAKRWGKDPVGHIVGYDALAIYVNMNNPLDSISFSELAQIYAEGGKLLNWIDLGAMVPHCEGQQIVLVGRQNTSGTYNYFRDNVIEGQCYKWNVVGMLRTEDVVSQVGENSCAIGYGALAFVNEQIKPLCVSDNKGGSCVNPSIETAIDGSYPLTRPLYMYTDGQPEGEIKSYLDWILSDEGQCIIYRKGYAPVRPVDCTKK